MLLLLFIFLMGCFFHNNLILTIIELLST
jgi:hypothetical protein